LPLFVGQGNGLVAYFWRVFALQGEACRLFFSPGDVPGAKLFSLAGEGASSALSCV
jgi:hypothetical protein